MHTDARNNFEGKMEILIGQDKVEVQAYRIWLRGEHELVFSGNAWTVPGMTGCFIRSNTMPGSHRARCFDSAIKRLTNQALMVLQNLKGV